ncbi:hypothetical protein PITC_054130 [Penicillium italicum]|uniref:Uncharacterized protein n=1 Tax=Penicillium italicum TaxID=40296 RepID=A0A0A2KPG5_PENIT|nr:hypothetical protein PITC_054130 [Penicillium italicum]
MYSGPSWKYHAQSTHVASIASNSRLRKDYSRSLFLCPDFHCQDTMI